MSGDGDRARDKVDRAIALLQYVRDGLGPAVFASSLGAEDMVLTDMIARHAPEIGIFSLDTGRLPEETHRLMRKVFERYPVRLQVYFPAAGDVEALIHAHGVNGFYDSVDARKACCRARKVLPLERALAGKKAWITGLRREQAPSRTDLGEREDDVDHRMLKFNPLFDWTEAEVWSYIREHKVPYNVLHDRSFPSIGCAPCTRAVAPGEDPRAGRWWWEHSGHKECGLHVTAAHQESNQEAPEPAANPS